MIASRLFHSVCTSCLFFALLVAQTAWAVSGTTVTVQGERFEATIEGLESEQNVRFQQEGTSRVVPLSQLVSWGQRRDWDGGTLVLLADRGWLVGSVVQLTPTSVVLETLVWGELTLERAQVRAVLFRPPLDLLRRDRLIARIYASENAQDEILLDNEDVLQGVLVAGPDTVAAEQQLRLRINATDVPLPWDRLVGVIFGGAGTSWENSAELVLLSFQNGTHLPARRVAEQQGRVRVETVGGLQLESSSRLFWRNLVMLQPLGKHVAYLSNLPDLGYKHLPFLQIEWPLGRDRNVRQGFLRAGEVLYSKGLGMPSSSRVAYDLGGRYARLEAELAIDRLAEGQGSVTFRVFGDRGEGQWTSLYESPLIDGQTTPVPISIDVRDVQRIALLVNYGAWGDGRDFANWLQARLVPRQEE